MSRECAICLGEWSLDSNTRHAPCVLDCGHVFGQKCIIAWMSTNPSCPVCKHPATRASVKDLPAPAIDGMDVRDLNSILRSTLGEVDAQREKTRDGFRRRSDCVQLTESMRGYVGHVLASAACVPPATLSLLPAYCYSLDAILPHEEITEREASPPTPPAPLLVASTKKANEGRSPPDEVHADDVLVAVAPVQPFVPPPGLRGVLHRGCAWLVAASAAFVYVVSPQRGLRRAVPLPFLPCSIAACPKTGRVCVYGESEVAGLEGSDTKVLFTRSVGAAIASLSFGGSQRGHVVVAGRDGRLWELLWPAGEGSLQAVKEEPVLAGGKRKRKPASTGGMGYAALSDGVCARLREECIEDEGGAKRMEGLGGACPPGPPSPIDGGFFGGSAVEDVLHLTLNGRQSLVASYTGGVALKRGRQPWQMLQSCPPGSGRAPLVSHAEELRRLLVAMPHPSRAGATLVCVFDTVAFNDPPTRTTLNVPFADMRNLTTAVAPVQCSHDPSDTDPQRDVDVVVIDVDDDDKGGSPVAKPRLFFAHTTASQPSVVFWRSVSSVNTVLQTSEGVGAVLSLAADANHVLVVTEQAMTWYVLLA
eukprot:TRINITY_DN6529_c2_g1_i1.p1 TRINITY_DN6529_c2_g1~~TRINITY_DN6529_c2_g1_i1.p1  ORF type:complete len:590 (+),score=80.86 TRINITY_DN6529_c2_g1_i1:130-1899(+)